jgi:hypothetical protein
MREKQFVMGSLPHHHITQGSIHFLKRDSLYKEEKPYTIRYTTPDDVPRTNSQHEERHGILIEDVRGHLLDFSIAKNGFMITQLDYDGGMTYDDFAMHDNIVDLYLPSVARKLREVLNARHVQIYEHTVRIFPGDLNSSLPAC